MKKIIVTLMLGAFILPSSGCIVRTGRARYKRHHHKHRCVGHRCKPRRRHR